MDSLDCSQLGTNNPEGLAALLRSDAPGDWLRCVGYHESTAGDLDRHGLDRLCASRPVRVQHSSGKLWILNSAAIVRLGLTRETRESGVELDAAGQPNGRLWRMDDWLRRHLPDAAPPNLSALSQRLSAYGITGVTDASYTNDQAAAQYLQHAHERGELCQRVAIMGDESLARGALKIMLDEDDLPELDALVARIKAAHARGRPVAFHCVSHVELLVALSALVEAGPQPSDRIEHAGVVRPEMLQPLAASGATVVTQPGFVSHRGDRFRQASDRDDRDHLYPYASLLAAGVPVAASSDAPYGPVNPWQIMATAVTRRTASGAQLGAGETVSAGEALRGYLSSAQNPGGAARGLEPGCAADLCVINVSLADALQDLVAVQVTHTVIGGKLVYDSSESTSSVCSPR